MNNSTSLRHIPLLAALAMLSGALPTLAQTPTNSQTHPPIPIKFKLVQPGFVTLVIDDAQGRRIRNLISETPYPAGENTAWWDGLDDLGRDADAASHAVYHIPGKIVAPATYQVHGLTRQKLDVRYQMTAYTNGNPPWHTKDQASEWLGNHQPPCSVMAIPAGAAPSRTTDSKSPAQVLVGSWVTEGGSGLAWLDENGRKLHGQSWLGGVWTGAQFLAYDAGPHPVSNVYAYAGSFWAGDKYNDNQSELRLHTLVSDLSQVTAPKDKRFGTGEDPAILSPTYKLGPATQSGEGRTLTGLNGLAVYNGILVASLPQTAELLFIDVAAHKTLGTAPLADPRGLAFDAQGRLIALSGTKLVRFALNTQDPTKLSKSEVLVTEGLVDPQQLAIDAQGAIYVSDDGENNQVKVFGASGKLLRTIGHPGPSVAGPYDAEHMNEPAGLTIDSQGRLWVAEHDFQPKRVSVWNAQTGALLNAFYGPARYGGGGELDPTDKTLFYYDGMTFKLDWQARTSRPIDVFYREGPDTGVTPSLGVPQTPLYAPNGHQYLTSAFSTSPTSGSNLVGLWQMKNGVAQPVAVAGQSRNWPEVNFASRFSVRWSGQVRPQYSETYTFHVESDDRVRLMVNGQGIINNFKNHDRMTDTATIDLQAGKRYDISIEYSKPRSRGVMRLSWSSPSQAMEVVPASALYPISKAAQSGGLTAQYYRDADFTNLTATRIDPTISFDLTRDGRKGWPLPEIAGMASRLPAGADLSKDPYFFTWSDANCNGQVQPSEVTFTPGESGSVTVLSDLSLSVAYVGTQAMRFAPTQVSSNGVLIYDALHGTVLAENTQRPTSSGGGQILPGKNGWTVLTTAPKPFAPQGVGGVKDGVALWSYPSLWPGLHASHNAPMPDRPGELLGTTRLLGSWVVPPKPSDAGPLWAINGNQGNVYLMTQDGLFVATLFRDSRTASWDAPTAERDMSVNDLSLQAEDFFPSITQTSDGQVYLQANVCCLSRIDGLDTVKRLPSQTLKITPTQLAEAQAYFVQSEAIRQQSQTHGPLDVALRPAPPVVDGKLSEWPASSFVTIDQRTDLVGNWGHKAAKTEAAIAVSSGILYAAYQTGDPKTLDNSGKSIPNLFKTGGGLDLQFTGTNGPARLLVSQVKGKTVAVLYQSHVPGTTTQAVLFSSPLRTVKMDRVDDVSDQVKLAADGQGGFELSVPLALLGLSPQPGQSIKGDIGLLRGNGFETLQRVYWNNKSTGLVSDVPSEAELTPQVWGSWNFE